MEPKTRLLLNELALTVVGWILLSYLYYFFAFWGQIPLIGDGLIREYMSSGAAHIELLSQGVFFGCFLALINFLAEKPALRKRPLGQIIAIKTVLYIVAMLVVGGIVYAIFIMLHVYPPEVLQQLWLELPARTYVSAGVFLALAIIGINFLHEIQHKFGPGNLLNMLLGRYYHPKVEDRIFLFLDLRGSTTIAEQLGHVKYSRFIRSCFHDLTDLVVRYGAQVYQYVGDEVVVSWPANGRTDPLDSVRMFLAFDRRLIQRRAAYEARFGVAPFFRGGIDMGAVTVAEVGDIKREIAYHGDVLNTAARLQELCKKYDVPLLMSERVHAALHPDPHFTPVLQDQIELRGKSLPIGVYSVTANGSPRST